MPCRANGSGECWRCLRSQGGIDIVSLGSVGDEGDGHVSRSFVAEHAAIATDAFVDLIRADPNTEAARGAPLLPLIGRRRNSNHAGQALGHVFVDMFWSFARDIDRERAFEVVADESCPATPLVLSGVMVRVSPGFLAVQGIAKLGGLTGVNALVPLREITGHPETDFVTTRNGTDFADELVPVH